jgi:hypothetical protein
MWQNSFLEVREQFGYQVSRHAMPFTAANSHNNNAVCVLHSSTLTAVTAPAALNGRGGQWWAVPSSKEW